MYLTFEWSATTTGEECEMTVSDTGVGFSPKGVEKSKIEPKPTRPEERVGLEDHPGLMDE